MEKLIDIVRDHPMLYDTSHKDYMKRRLKDHLWNKIAKELKYTDGKTAKEAWWKLRECHREALRRQQKKRGHIATNTRLWKYQKRMKFLQPFMKKRTTDGNLQPTAFVESELEDDGTGEEVKIDVDEMTYYAYGEPPLKNLQLISPHASIVITDEVDDYTERSTPKKLKNSTAVDSTLRKYLEESDRRANMTDEFQRTLIDQTQKSLHTDALYHFFMSMYNSTKVLSIKYQREVRRKVFEAVSQAEDDDANEAQNLYTNTNSLSCSESSAFSIMTENRPEFFNSHNGEKLTVAHDLKHEEEN